MRRKFSAFTLVELLLIVAIIGVLATLLLPVLSEVRQRALAARCVSNLKSAGLLVLAHASDNEGKSVSAYNEEKRMWYQQLIDAGFITAGEVRDSFASPLFNFPKDGVSGMAAYGIRQMGSSSNPVPTYTMSSVERPSHYILLATTYNTSTKGQFYYMTRPYGTAKMLAVYKGNVHAAFADGSVRGISADEIVNLDDGWRRQAIIDINEIN